MSLSFDVGKGKANFAPSDAVYQQQSGIAQLPSSETTAAGRNWPRVFLIMSAISSGLIMAGGILDILTLQFRPSALFLDVYLVVFAFFAFTAELRQVNCLRGVVYLWIRYVYFLTTYAGRSTFYIFLGTLSFGESLAQYFASGVAIALGLLMFAVNLFVKLPIYTDAEVVREEEAYRAAVGIGQSLFMQPATTADYRFHGLETANSNEQGGYKPPGINEGPNAL